MANKPFLAMTAREIAQCQRLPPHICWIDCRFSPDDNGLADLPEELLPGSLLCLNDMVPLSGQDFQTITRQLSDCITQFSCPAVLLDFQRPPTDETLSLVRHLVSELPRPVVVSDLYAGALDCPVFLPPVPPSVPLEEYLTPWKGRDIWLELGLVGEILTLTEAGCEAVPFSCQNHCGEGFADDALHCHYTIDTNEKAARFTLWRTKDDLNALLAAAETIGITSAVGLYQELR